MKQWVKGMRDSFFDSFFQIAKKDKNVILVTSDTGAICHNNLRKELSNRYINIGIAEQNMIGVAAGLAMASKRVYVYAIIPFATMRCYEQIRVDLCCMNLPVTIVGIGAGVDYSTLGPTHHGTEDIALMRVLPGMTIYSPSDNLLAGLLGKISVKKRGPEYIRLDRTGYPLIYNNEKEVDISQGISVPKEGKDLYIIATGRMVYSALQAAKELSKYSINAGVIDLFRIKPLNEEMIWGVIENVKFVVSLEEHFTTAGIAEAIGMMLLSAPKNNKAFYSIGIPNEFCRKYGSREYLHKINSIDVNSIIKGIKNFVNKY